MPSKILNKAVFVIVLSLVFLLSGCVYSSRYVDDLKEEWTNKYNELESKYDTVSGELDEIYPDYEFYKGFYEFTKDKLDETLHDSSDLWEYFEGDDEPDISVAYNAFVDYDLKIREIIDY